MIQFTLKCDRDHRFDSWFQSAHAFETLQASGQVACPVCGSTRVEKALMAPRVQSRREPARAKDEASSTDAPLSTTRADPAAQALAELKRHVERNSDDVGKEFAREARDMHAGLIPERAIHGEARAEEAKKLIEEGVPVAPLPFRTGRKVN